MERTVFFGFGVIFSVIGVRLFILGWLGYQQLQAAYLSCEASHVQAPCHHVFNGAFFPQLMQQLGTFLIVLGIAVILLGFVQKSSRLIPANESFHLAE